MIVKLHRCDPNSMYKHVAIAIIHHQSGNYALVKEHCHPHIIYNQCGYKFEYCTFIT